MRISVLVFLASMSLAACGPAESADPGGPTVLAAETFLADIAQNVAGDRLVIDSILAPGVDPHEFQATPKEAVRIAKSDLLIINGRGYEAWLQRTLDVGAGGYVVIETTAGLPVGPESDPHLWMDPRNVMHYVENIRDGLVGIDPAGSAEYAANADRYKAELESLDHWIRTEVEGIPAERRALITNHDALEAFAEAYGFEIAGVIIPSYSSGAAASAQALTELIGTIRARQAPAIFLDVSESQDLAQQIAAESGACVVTDLYVETLSTPEGPAPTYVAMMQHNVRLIVEALK